MLHLNAHKQLVSNPLADHNFSILLDRPYWGRSLVHCVLADGSCKSPTRLAIVMASKNAVKRKTNHHLLVQMASCRN